MEIDINKEYLKYSNERKLKEIKAIVIHWTANSGTNAKQNIEYFRKRNTLGYHFIIDNDGTIYQMQNLSKRVLHCGCRKYSSEATKFFGKHQAPDYLHTADHQHTGSPNNLTIGICFCNIDKSGKPTDEAYKSLVKLSAWLCLKYKLTYRGGIWRHYDIVDSVDNKPIKKCPKYYVDNIDKFIILLHDIGNAMVE